MPLPNLPTEIKNAILQSLIDDGCKVARFATVSPGWQEIIEKHNFTNIRLTQWRISDLNRMTQRNRARIKSIWFWVELEQYDCMTCSRLYLSNEIDAATRRRTDILIMNALEDLFVALSSWTNEGLTLDISIYSESDARHSLKHLTCEPDLASEEGNASREKELTKIARGMRSDRHRKGGRVKQMLLLDHGIEKTFANIMSMHFSGHSLEAAQERRHQWWQKLPQVPAVTRLLLRQQTQRRWHLDTVAKMLHKFPNLSELHYEPWREWNDWFQEVTDRGE